jgi:signal transduction histidine kinase
MSDGLLPGELRDTPDGRRSARDWIVDAALFLLAAALGLAILDETWPEHSALGAVVDVVAGIVSLAALWLRRSRPVAVAVFTLVVALFSGLAAGASLVALFNAALRASRRSFAWIVALSIPPAVVFPLIYPTDDPYATQVIVGVLLTVVVIGWGLFARARRELVRSLRERAERLETEQRLRVEQAREAERRRIAREMHDVLAHRLSLLSVHAGALEFSADRPAEAIAEASGVIRESARAALEELRGVIGVLREDAGESLTQPPQPTLSDLPALVEESRAAGMRITARIELGDAAPPTAVGRTAYRIAQEGLTNARKHAPGAAVTLTVDAAGGDLRIEVRSLAPVSVASVPLPGAGTGLIGLAERVALAKGELEHGVDADGAFVLRARLPR